MATERIGGIGPRQDRAALAREVNAAILALEARLDDESFLARDPARQLIGFCCECGCLAVVARTRNEYEAAVGAWIDGHEPLRASA